MKNKLLLLIFTTLSIAGCKKDQAASSLEKQITSNWLVVDSSGNQMVVEWSQFYIGSVKLYADRSFNFNIGTGIDTFTSRHGRWTLDDNSSMITFYTLVEIPGVPKDTTRFDISIDEKGRMLLKNSVMTILHKRMGN